MSGELKNLRILANAGSGKTHRLVTRYIELLARGFGAERIVALTFTRKAAGEFLEKIFQRLALGAQSESSAEQLASDTGVEGISPVICLNLLRDLIEKLPRLPLGTLDGFFARVVQSFPFECGMAGEMTILDDHELTQGRRDALDALFRSQSGGKGAHELMRLIREQNQHAEERGVTKALNQQIALLHERFLITPEGIRWGDERAIWPGKGSGLLRGDELLEYCREFEQIVFGNFPDMEARHQDAWRTAFQEIRNLSSGGLAGAMKLAAKLVNPGESQKKNGHFVITLDRKGFEFSDAFFDVARRLGLAIMAFDVGLRLMRTRALYSLLEKFEQTYRKMARNSGRLTFFDRTALLAEASGSAWGTKSLRRINRINMDFRLDAACDHWLLDEFQDTSRFQWEALRDLADEVIQSESGRRSFFFVGDAKQAIYSWRGGDHRLFEEIASFYNQSGSEKIDTSEHLDISYRSRPEILDFINRLFDPEHLRCPVENLELPAAALEEWKKSWSNHRPHKTERGHGYVRWNVVQESENDDEDAVTNEAADFITSINPCAKGWSCAVLVRSNARMELMIQALRNRGIKASAEGRLAFCSDNGACTVVLSLIRWLAHPIDLHSLEFVKMSPLRILLNEDPEVFRLQALEAIAAQGIAVSLRSWLKLVSTKIPDFARGRIRQLCETAAQFDGSGGTLDDFVEYALSRQMVEPPASGSVRVMTIHGAKGLDFDMVVLPDLEGDALSSRRDDAPVFLKRNQERKIHWGMDLPVKSVCLSDQTLRDAWEEAEAEAFYERLCLYYVATTRPKHALYLFSSAMKEESKARDFNKLLHLYFGSDGYEAGNSTWYLETPSSPIENTQKGKFPKFPDAFALTPLSEPLFPSHENSRPAPLGGLLDATALAIGAAVHEALAGIAWNDDVVLPCLGETEREIVERFLQSPAASEVFARPAGLHDLWRERAFDIIQEGRRLSGIFDRVLILKDSHGSVTGVRLWDFKTGMGDEEDFLERHEGQLVLYRSSLSALLKIPEDRIDAWIVAVSSGRLIAVD